jgi:NitT/TauT family transport system ATP-binding protein
MVSETRKAVLELRRVGMAFARPDGAAIQALADIDVALREGEILGLLGRSGSGKSTVLRIAGGLLRPTSGEVVYRGAPLAEPAEGIAIVFQTFALFPWLTVAENVGLGLDAIGTPAEDADRRVQAAIEMIGLDGFQTAYPRELSGGMRQRVGFARAIVVDPVVLLMDEPFSALDALTQETLRTDFLDLWLEHQLPTKSVLLVTHNIEEAVLMCDRILVLASQPGRIVAEVPVALPRPRSRVDEAFRKVVDEIYAALTARTVSAGVDESQVRAHPAQALPRASVAQIHGLIQNLAAPPYAGHAALATLAWALTLQVDDLLPIAEALQLLEFAELKDGALKLTAAGRVFAQSHETERKKLFAEHLLEFVPLAAHIRRIVDERDDNRAPAARFEAELEDHLTRRDAERTLRVVGGWGRYAGVFAYDGRTRAFTRSGKGAL